MRANDTTRRYRLVRGPEGDQVGGVEVGGTAPTGDTAVLTVTCLPVLSDAPREDALATARRFLGELVAGWGLKADEVRGGAGEWVEQPDGSSRLREEHRVG
jgi:hypothetical protein